MMIDNFQAAVIKSTACAASPEGIWTKQHNFRAGIKLAASASSRKTKMIKSRNPGESTDDGLACGQMGDGLTPIDSWILVSQEAFASSRLDHGFKVYLQLSLLRSLC